MQFRCAAYGKVCVGTAAMFTPCFMRIVRTRTLGSWGFGAGPAEGGLTVGEGVHLDGV
jgi:hypothetical protein